MLTLAFLDRHTLLETRDLDELRARVAQEIGRHDMDVLGPARDFDTRICAASLAGLPLFHVSYGQVSMEICVRDLVQDAFMLVVPTSGVGHVRQGRDTGTMSRGRVLMRDMRRPIASRQVDFGCLSVSVPLSRLRRQAEALYGPGAADAGLSFGLIADLRTPRGRHLHDTIHFVADQLNGAAGAIDRLTAAAWEDLLLTQMLSALPNSLEDVAGQAPRSGALPYHVKRARDFIHDHAQDRIASADLARAAGCSLRTLQGAFAETIGLSPMGYLKAVRLERAHGDLRAARASCHRGRDRAPLGLRAAGPFRPRLSAALRLHPDRDSAQRRLRRRVGRCGARGSRLSKCARSVRKAQETVRSAASALPAGPTLVQCQRIIVGSDMGW